MELIKLKLKIFYFNISRYFMLEWNCQLLKIGKIHQTAIVPKMTIWGAEAFLVWSLGNFIPMILNHSHSFSRPNVCGKPSCLRMPIFVGKDKPLSFSDMFSAFRQSLHALWFFQILLHWSSNVNRNSKAIMTHCSSSQGFSNTLMTSFLGILLKRRSKF